MSLTPTSKAWKFASITWRYGRASYLAWLAVKSNFGRVTVLFTRVAYDIERLPIALASTALLMILCKAGALRWLTSQRAAIGQTALSNYILQSVVCSFLFTGYGFGLYGRLQFGSGTTALGPSNGAGGR